jgi:RNase P/RNase MRP subunit p30
MDVVESASSELLRKAAKKSVLINCLQVKNFQKDEGLIRAVAEGESAFEIPISVLLHSNGTQRANLLRRLRFFVKKCLKLKAKFVFTLRAKSKFDLKTPREVAAIAQLLGLSKEQAVLIIKKSGLN